MKTRVEWVDSVKGIAMLSVVICHVMNGYMTANVFDNQNDLLYMVQNIMNSYQMPLFCIMSGYLFSSAYVLPDKRVNSEKIKKQIMNLILLYVIWCFIMGLFKIVLSNSVNNETKLLDLLMLWCRPIGVFWWLYVLVALYLLFCLLIRMNDTHAVLIALTFGMVGSLLDDSFLDGLFCIRRIFYYIFFFTVGYLLNKRFDLKKYTAFVITFFIVSIGLVVLFWSKTVEIYHIHLLNLFIALGICLFLVLVAQTNNIIKRLRILRILGQNSLEIYTMHVFITAGVRIMTVKLGFTNCIVSIAVTVFMAIFIPLIAGKLLKKLKIYDILFSPNKVICRLKRGE